MYKKAHGSSIVMAKTWKLNKGPSKAGWIKKTVYLHNKAIYNFIEKKALQKINTLQLLVIKCINSNVEQNLNVVDYTKFEKHAKLVFKNVYLVVKL